MINLQEMKIPSKIDHLGIAADAEGVARRTKDLGEGISKRLKAAQKDAGLTVRELAARSHVTPPTIMRVRNGGGGGMAAGILADIARALKVQPCWLLFGAGDKDPPA